MHYVFYFKPQLLGFEVYRLNGLRLTEEEIGRGSYAVVMKLEYRGLKCAGKQLYPILYEQEVGETVRRFEEECRLLAQMRHPNIVQFIGVYFEEGSRVPILVMEFLPTTLARCIDTYGVFPEEVSYSILYDVAVGLYHLHSQTPPIVHRDLSANNVLLTPNMTAKISDLGVAKILNLTPLQMSHMTRTPGTPSYTPPEAMRANPRYDTRIDEFSYGILMIHVLCGRWPLPVCEAARPDPQNPDQLIPVSEADRREEYLQDIGDGHPLMNLILRCVSNNPVRRARAAEIIQQMSDMVHQFPPTFANRVEMLQQIKTESNEKQTLRAESQRLAAEAQESRLEMEELIKQHKAEVEQVRSAELNGQSTAAQMQLRSENERLVNLAQHCQEDVERSKLAHSIEIEKTRLQLEHSIALQADLKSHIDTLQARLRSENEMHQVKLKAEIEAREQEERAHSRELESLEAEVARVRRANRNLQASVASKDRETLSKDREILSKRAEISANHAEIAMLRAVVVSKDQEIESKQQEVDFNERELSGKRKLIAAMSVEISTKEAVIVAKDATLAQKELVSRNAVLERQSSTVQGLSEQLTRAREILSKEKPQVTN